MTPFRALLAVPLLVVAVLLAPSTALAAKRCPVPQRKGSTIRADLAVVGADAGGTGAAIAAARRCLSVGLVSETAPPGGMLTAGQIGFVDGEPKFLWQDKINPAFPNGTLGSGTSWALAGG